MELSNTRSDFQFMSQAQSQLSTFLGRLSGSSFAHNVSWNILGSMGGKFLGPMFQVLIARLLLPADFGVFAIGLAWIAAFEIIKDWGLTHAILVRRGGKAEIVLQFTVQILTALCFYLITLGLTPVAADLFGLVDLTVVLPLVGLTVFISAVADPIITDYLMAQRYRQLALRQMTMPIASGVVGLLLAHFGYGVYSLVFGLLVGHLVGVLSLVVSGHTGLGFSLDFGLVRNLMPIGKHIVLQRLFGFLVGQADSFIVGRALGAQALGLYRMGNMLAFLFPASSVAQTQQVVFTELSAKREVEQLRARYNQFTVLAGGALLLYSMAAYLSAPMLVPLVLGEQWRDAVPLMQIFTAVVVSGFLTPLNVDLAKVLGFVHIYTHFALWRSIATVTALLWASQYSTLYVVIAWVVVGFMSNLVNDVIFYRMQSVVRVTGTKIVLICTSWVWATIVIALALAY
jgi:O-antigen/teichoic acid export membrane protein